MTDVQHEPQPAAESQGFPLRLILVQSGRPRLVWLNPGDAAAAGVVNGAVCRLVSPGGSIELPAMLTDEIRPGTVGVPDAWDHTGDGTPVRLEAAAPPTGSTAHIFGPP
jgi:anaerobic selenocysteine-containing dehydrogenase